MPRLRYTFLQPIVYIVASEPQILKRIRQIKRIYKQMQTQMQCKNALPC